MNRRPSPKFARSQRQSGITLIIGLIVLVLVTLTVVLGYNMSSSGLRATANQQIRDEAVAAGNMVLEKLVSNTTDLSANGAGAATEVVFKDGKFTIKGASDTSSDFTVTPEVTCISATQLTGAAGSDSELDASLRASGNWYVEKDVKVTVSGSGVAQGTSLVIHQGVKVQMTDSEKLAACPT